MAIKHSYVHASADLADTSVVRPSDWNADHTVADGSLTIAKTSGLQSALDVRGISVMDYGAVGDGVVDCTSAFQSALDAAIASGGTVIVPAGNYLVSSTLTLGDSSSSVRLIGNSKGLGAVGSRIKWTGAGPCITIPGCVHWEIANLRIDGVSTGENGVLITSNAAGTQVARSGILRDMVITGLTDKCITLTSFSYVTIARVSTTGGTLGVYIAPDNGVLKEFLRINESSVHAATVCGMHLAEGSQIHLYSVNITGSPIGLLIGGTGAGEVFHVHSDKLTVDNCTTYSIEVFADAASVMRSSFRDTYIFMKGVDVGEKAIYVHRSSTFIMGRTMFDGIDVAKAGSTAPTIALDFSLLSDNSSLRGIRNVAGGTMVIGSPTTLVEPTVAAAAPTTGAHLIREIVYNSAPAADGYLGWVCVTAGTPGTWKGFGAIAS